MDAQEILLKEYEIGNDLTQSYLRSAWTVASIFLPICFGLIAVSYTSELLSLNYQDLLPLALASIVLNAYSWSHGRRYSSFSRSIWNRLQEIEKETGMNLHTQIDKKDQDRRLKWRIFHVNAILLILLIALWVLRLYFAPL